ncbi:MAG: glycosyltransferase family 4 protein [Phycisphaeraceae bacterium]|nr:glycosyltransferase family 4 protein [Phycisphaeraceae bacterium]
MSDGSSRIAVDARWIGPHGIGRFAREVIARLPGAVPVPVRGHPARPFSPLRLALGCRRVRADVFFTPGFVAPLPAPRRMPVVLTIHDLIHLDDPDERSMAKRAFYAAVVRPAARRAARVLTVSEHSKQRLCAWAGLPGDRCVVVGNGVSAAFTPTPRSASGPATMPSEAPYLLFVGSEKPHKNLPLLLKAFGQTRCRGAVRLRCCGLMTDNARRWASECGVGRAVDFVRPADDEALAAHYRRALALVMPSRDEGFGLPVAEAMACGTPVIATAAGALPEVVGDAGMLVHPDDPAALTEAIDALVTDGPRRADLRDRGLARSALWRWDGVAERVLGVVEGVR